MVQQVLCVAEKPSIAKAVANHLSDNNVTTVSNKSLSESSILKSDICHFTSVTSKVINS